MLHVELVEAAAQAGKHVFCEKPVGGTPEQTARAERAVRRAGVIGGVGFNYRWAPLVRYAAELIAAGELGALTNYRGRFFSMYGADPLGVLSWRFRLDEGGHGVTSDLLSHAVDLAHFLAGPITRVVGTTATFIPRAPARRRLALRPRPAPRIRTARSRTRTTPGCCASSRAARAGRSRRAARSSGPRARWRSTCTAPPARPAGTSRRSTSCGSTAPPPDRGSGYTTVLGGERFPPHGAFVPGSANGIGFEDLVTIEDAEFCAAVAEGRPFSPGFDAALAWVVGPGGAAALGAVGPLGGRRLAAGGLMRCGSR